MIQLEYDSELQGVDLQRDGGNITDNELLNTAVLISLFTRRRADPDDILPDPRSHREGWWADDYAQDEGDLIGSRLWLLARSKATQSVLNRAKNYAEESLAWLIDDGIASRVIVTVERYQKRPDVIAIRVEIYKPDAPATRWVGVWQAHLEAL